jgi:hypothetical protein
MCPGWNRPPHLAARLSLDHIVPRARGGDPWAESNLQVMCTDCNAAKGSSLALSGASGLVVAWSGEPADGLVATVRAWLAKGATV